MKIGIKIVILTVLFIISIVTFLYYNLPYQQKETPGSFATYLDPQSSSKGYSFSKCRIDAIDFSTDVKSLFYFSCNLKQDKPDLPIGFIVTFPFKIGKNGSVCRQSLNVNTTSKEVVLGENECINIESSVDKEYILRGLFEEYNQAKFFYQFVLYGDGIFYRVSPERLRFKMPITTNDLSITAGYCTEMGLPAGCAKLTLPEELILRLKIPRDKYEIDFSNAYPQFLLKDNGGDGYEISWNIKDATFIQFDLIDTNKERAKTIVNFITPTLFGIILGIFIQSWLEKKGKR